MERVPAGAAAPRATAAALAQLLERGCAPQPTTTTTTLRSQLQAAPGVGAQRGGETGTVAVPRLFLELENISERSGTAPEQQAPVAAVPSLQRCLILLLELLMQPTNRLQERSSGSVWDGRCAEPLAVGGWPLLSATCHPCRTAEVAFYRAHTHTHTHTVPTDTDRAGAAGAGRWGGCRAREGYPTPASFYLSLCAIGSVRAQLV